MQKNQNPRRKDLKQCLDMFAVIIIFSLIFLVGCGTIVTPEPPIDRSDMIIVTALPTSTTAAHLPDTPTGDSAAEPTTKPTTESSTPTLVPTASPEPTNTPDPHIPPLDPVLGSTWQGPANGMEMVFVPAGTFAMGSTDADIDNFLIFCEQILGEGKCWRDWFSDEQPNHEITLGDFWIQRTEVTNAQYSAFLNELGNQRENEADWYDLDNPGAQIIEEAGAFLPLTGLADHPAVAVTWHGADAYCGWYDALLPTEAQWEYAARGEESHPYPWGGAAPTCDLALYWQCGGKSTAVDDYQQGASWTGALNMAGNVWEWVADWYGSSTYETSEIEDPIGPPLGKSKVLRGGGWDTRPHDLRSSNRSFGDPEFATDVIGFRCAVEGS